MAERLGVLRWGDFSRIADSIELLLRVIDDQLEIAWKQDKDSTWATLLVPAWAVLGEDVANNTVWGVHAQAWALRGRAATALFPLGYPSEPGVVRSFLGHLVLEHLTLVRNPRVVVGLTTSSELEREIWQEVFDEGGWQLCGFLSEPLYLRALYPDAHQEFSKPGAIPKTLLLELRLDGLRWLALEGDRIKVQGEEPGLGSRTLVRGFQHYLRHTHSLEASEMVASAFLLSNGEQRGSQVAGRQLHSGLPTRVEVDLAQYWSQDSRVGPLWNELKNQIAFQVLGRGAGDPWRLLSDSGWNLVVDRALPCGAWEQKTEDSGLVR